MKMKKITLIILIALQLSCNNKDSKQAISLYKAIGKSKPVEIKIDVSESSTYRIPEDLFDEPTFVKLETANNNLIGKISQVIFHNNLIIVVDNTISNSINVFDMNGKFKNKIGKPGQGPGEYISCHHVAKVPDKDIIAVLDDKLAKVHYYKIDGEYMNSVKFDFSTTDMEFINPEQIAFVGLNNKELNNNDLIITDPKNKVLSAGFKGLYKENKFTYSNVKRMSKYGNTVFFNPNYNDTIFEIGDKNIQARYHIDIVKHKFPKINDKTTDADMDAYYKKYITFNGDFFEFEKAALFYISVPNSTSPFAIYSKELKETYKWNLQSYNPFYIFLSMGEPNARFKNNTLVYSVPAQHVILAKKIFDEKVERYHISKSKVDELFNGLSEEDNPVLFFYNINIKKQNLK